MTKRWDHACVPIQREGRQEITGRDRNDGIARGVSTAIHIKIDR